MNIKTQLLTKEEPSFQGKRVRVVRADFEPIIAMYSGAWSMAVDAGLDLVLVADGELPVVKIMDQSRESYKKKKQLKNKVTKNKEVKFGMRIEDHDYNTKLNQIRKFLGKKMRVRLTLFMKTRRDMQDVDGAKALLTRVLEDLVNDCTPESEMKHAGRTVGVTVIHKG